MSDDWREPYRTMDASGDPSTAGAVGLAWVEAEAKRAMQFKGGMASIETIGTSAGVSVFSAYHGTKLIACATIFRDPMNFAVLVRWRAQ